MDYSAEVLIKISSSSKSAIRHSTKSNVNFAYKADRPFRCEKETNSFKADCMPMCPNYSRVYDDVDAVRRAEMVRGPIIGMGGVKARYKEQFGKAMELATEQNGAWISFDEIAQRLNEQGFKSKTGKPWTSSLVCREVATARGAIVNGSEQNNQPGAEASTAFYGERHVNEGTERSSANGAAAGVCRIRSEVLAEAGLRTI